MAILQLDRVWLHLVSTGEAAAAFSTGRGRDHAMDGEVRTYAGGRQRAVGTEGVKGQYAVTLRLLSKSTVEKLESWIGQHVQLRDHRGQRFFGAYFAVTPIEQPEPTLWDVAIVLLLVTVDEGV